jgi:predicted nuclease of predicted toxin-antitoxin system
VKFLVDAQLPRRLAQWLQSTGHDAVHTLDLPSGNRTTDQEINDRSEHEQRAVITKDMDFVDSFLLTGKPYQLLLISTGNIRNADLEALFIVQLPAIVIEFATCRFVEMTRAGYIVRA